MACEACPDPLGAGASAEYCSKPETVTFNTAGTTQPETAICGMALAKLCRMNKGRLLVDRHGDNYLIAVLDPTLPLHNI